MFDRKKLVEDLLNEYTDVSFEPAKEDVFYDAVLIVNGCGRACAGHEVLKAGQKIFVTNPRDVGKIRKAMAINYCADM